MMRAIDNRFGILEECTLEEYVREGNEQRRLVYRRKHAIEWHSDAVV